MKRRTFVALSTVFASAHAFADDVATRFADDRLEIVLPSSFKILEKPLDGLIAVFGPQQDNRLELTLTDMEGSAAPSDVAERFVRSQAEKKKLRAKEMSGKVVVMEPGGAFKRDDVEFRTVHRQIGFGRSLVVMTLTAPAALPMSPALDDFLGQPLNIAVSTLRRR